MIIHINREKLIQLPMNHNNVEYHSMPHHGRNIAQPNEVGMAMVETY